MKTMVSKNWKPVVKFYNGQSFGSGGYKLIKIQI